MPDNTNNPAHYTVYPVETIELTRELGFCIGNVVKYVLRAPYKGKSEDLDKALRFLDFEAMSFQRGIPPRVFEGWSAACQKLCEWLLNAEGDDLWDDTALFTADCLQAVADYLAGGDANLLVSIGFYIRELRRVFDLAAMPGEIYEGMSGYPARAAK